jgi:hypothetical protein
MVERFVYPLRKDPSELLKQIRRGAAEQEIDFDGDEQRGSFLKRKYFVVVLKGSYIVKSNDVHVSISVMPPGWNRSKVDREARKLFG